MDNEDRAPESAARRTALECMLWAGSGLLWTVAGGVPRARLLSVAEAAEPPSGLRFMQISDSHIGFRHAPNMDVAGTLARAVSEVRANAAGAALMLHTGDVSHLSRPAQFDTAEQIIRGAGLDTHYVPGEHDVLDQGGKPFFARFTPLAPETGWYSFDQQGVHFVGLNNVSDLKAGGLGRLGRAQIDWLKQDLAGRAASQPIVVFAHIPLWAVYPKWGWGTDDSVAALASLARFGSVTVLNGHIHQIMQKVEGHVAFHTARSTAFPQPAPGTAPSPGPMQVPAGRLSSVLGTTAISFVPGQEMLAIVDRPLGA